MDPGPRTLGPPCPRLVLRGRPAGTPLPSGSGANRERHQDGKREGLEPQSVSSNTKPGGWASIPRVLNLKPGIGSSTLSQRKKNLSFLNRKAKMASFFHNGPPKGNKQKKGKVKQSIATSK